VNPALKGRKGEDPRRKKRRTKKNNKMCKIMLNYDFMQ